MQRVSDIMKKRFTYLIICGMVAGILSGCPETAAPDTLCSSLTDAVSISPPQPDKKWR